MTGPSDSKLRIHSALLSQPLTGSDIHIWCASLDVPPYELPHYSSLLAVDEIERADRFYFEKDRDHFIVGRGLLRTLLGNYLDLEPTRIEFVYGPHGKPKIKSGSEDNILEFNLSHSRDRALYAFNWNRRLGIDLEYVNPLADMDDFAERFFTPRESARVNMLPGDRKTAAFFKTWTCKEAFLKANGSGLTVPIDQVEISFEAEGSAQLISIGDDREHASDWRLELFDPFPGYQAALAVEGRDGRMIFQKLEGQSAL